jgi:hypothetical protein
VNVLVDVRQTEDETDPVVAPGDPLVFSAFVDRLATLELSIAGDVVCTYTAGVASGCDVVDGFADDFVRVVADGTTPAIDFNASLTISGTIWSAQLENGGTVTSPFMFTVGVNQGNLVPFNFRFFEQLVLEQLALPVGAQTSLRASMAARGLPSQPVAIGEDVDLFRSLFIGLEAGDRADRAVMEASVSELDLNTLQVDVILAQSLEQAFIPGRPATVGADIGAPLSGCDDCFGGEGAVSTRVSSSVQWETLQLLGNGEAATVFDVELATRGPAPLPTALEMRAAAPANGCFEGLLPVAALVACGPAQDPINGGVCSEGPDRSWVGRVTSMDVGPGINELAATGSFETAKLETPLAELAFEVRYRHGGDGDVLQLLDADGNAFVRVADEGNLIRLIAPGIDETSEDEVVEIGQWLQLSCWLGASSQCTLNSGLPSALGVVNVRGVVLDGIRVGAPAEAVAFARVWAVPEGLSENEVIRQHVTRTAATMGLPFAERRAPAFWGETRPEPTTIVRNGVDVRIGPGWPRVENIDDVPTYLADPAAGEGLFVLALDLTGRERGAFDIQLAEETDGQIAALRSLFTGELLALAHVGDTTSVFRARQDNDGASVDQTATYPISGAHLELSWRGLLTFVEDRENKVLSSSPLFPISSMQFLEVPGTFVHPQVPGAAPIAMRSLRCGSR